jgi:hypothetical protein
MKYQLVLQFRALSISDFDRLVAFEEVPRVAMEDSVEIDGHDFGQDEFNIFIHTDEPTETFERILKLANGEYEMRAAFRDFAEEEYRILWPPGLTEFKIV